MAGDTYPHHMKTGAAGSPLVFTFHGTGGDEHQFPGLIDQILPQATIVSPRGDVSEHGANRFFRRTGEGVYDMEDLDRATGKMAAFMRAHIDAHPGAPVYAMGYSNGANILTSVLLRHPEIVRRAALLHPLVPWEPAPQSGFRNRRILVTAGRNDPICPWPQTESFLTYLRAQGAQVETVIHNGGHEIRQEEVVALASMLRAPEVATA